MKIRSGFVSNSSSSSFVLDKDSLTEEQKVIFKRLIIKHNCENSADGYLYEGKKHFFGEISQHAGYVFKFLDENKIEFESMC